MFFQYLAKDPHFYVYAVVTMVVSIVLHELAHGWAAIWQGDRTPIERGHMTIDPRVHMGLVSLVMVLTLGIGFGAMPVDPRRFRTRHGDLLVSAAGPLMNLLLALAALTALGVCELAVDEATPGSVLGDNLREFLWTFGYLNLGLGVFNLIPVPPLDGSSVLASLHRGYRRLIDSVQNPMVFLFAFMAVYSVLSSSDSNLYSFAAGWANHYLQWLYELGGQ